MTATAIDLAAQIEAAKKRVAEWPADVRVALGLPKEPNVDCAPSDVLKTMKDMLHVAQLGGCLVTLTAEQCKDVIREMERNTKPLERQPHTAVEHAQLAAEIAFQVFAKLGNPKSHPTTRDNLAEILAIAFDEYFDYLCKTHAVEKEANEGGPT